MWSLMWRLHHLESLSVALGRGSQPGRWDNLVSMRNEVESLLQIKEINEEMNLYSLHVHVAVQRGPLLSAPFVGIGILHFSVLKRKNDDAK